MLFHQVKVERMRFETYKMPNNSKTNKAVLKLTSNNTGLLLRSKNYFLTHCQLNMRCFSASACLYLYYTMLQSKFEDQAKILKTKRQSKNFILPAPIHLQVITHYT